MLRVFYHCMICVADSREGCLFGPLSSLSSPEKTHPEQGQNRCFNSTFFKLCSYSVYKLVNCKVSLNLILTLSLLNYSHIFEFSKAAFRSTFGRNIWRKKKWFVYQKSVFKKSILISVKHSVDITCVLIVSLLFKELIRNKIYIFVSLIFSRI